MLEDEEDRGVLLVGPVLGVASLAAYLSGRSALARVLAERSQALTGGQPTAELVLGMGEQMIAAQEATSALQAVLGAVP